MEEININSIIEKFSELLINSEKRIEKTNEMISRCVLFNEKITNEYVKQIERLQEQRDAITKQNASLLETIHNSEERYNIMEKKYDNLINIIMTHFSNKPSENNINVG